MTWNVPGWWAFVLLALAAFRVFRLVSEDVILDPARERVMRRLGPRSELFLLCPWCFGAWITVALWVAWLAWPHWTLVVATPFALSAIVALVASKLDDE